MILRRELAGLAILLTILGSRLPAQSSNDPSAPPGSGSASPPPDRAEPAPATKDPYGEEDSAPAMPADENEEHPLNSGMVPAPEEAPSALNVMPFEVDQLQWPFPETASSRRQETEDLPEASDEVPSLLPPPETLPALSIIPVIREGPLNLAFGARYEAMYDSNILLSSNDEQSDFEHILSPRISLSLGDSVQTDYTAPPSNYLTLAYAPQIIFFQHYGKYNAVDQQLRLDGQYALTRIVLKESLEYNHSSDADRELQGRNSRDILSSETNATYQASDQISYELGGTALVRNFQRGINSNEVRLRFWTRYAGIPSWTFSLAPALGVLLPEEGTSQIIEQAWASAQGKLGSTVSMDLTLGGDFREPQNSGRIYSTPVFYADIRYEPSTETKVVLSGVRQVLSSPDDLDENYISTKVSLKVTQRLWQTYEVGLEGGFENADYYQFGAASTGPRVDNYPYGKFEVSYARFQDLEVSAYYLIRKNFSTRDDLSFSDQQVGIQFRVGY